MEVQTLNHWTAREVPNCLFLILKSEHNFPRVYWRSHGILAGILPCDVRDIVLPSNGITGIPRKGQLFLLSFLKVGWATFTLQCVKYFPPQNYLLLLDRPALGGNAPSGLFNLFFERTKPTLVSGHWHMLFPGLGSLLSDSHKLNPLHPLVSVGSNTHCLRDTVYDCLCQFRAVIENLTQTGLNKKGNLLAHIPGSPEAVRVSGLVDPAVWSWHQGPRFSLASLHPQCQLHLTAHQNHLGALNDHPQLLSNQLGQSLCEWGPGPVVPKLGCT